MEDMEKQVAAYLNDTYFTVANPKVIISHIFIDFP